MKKKVIIVGSSGHSKVVIDIFEKSGNYEICGLIDSFREKGEETLGYKIIGNEEDLPLLVNKFQGCSLFVAIGDNWLRQTVVNRISSILPKAHYVSAIHPSSTIGKNVFIGEGVVIMAGAIINSDSKIKDFVIINTNASIDHDCILQKFSSFGPNSTLGGNVNVGEYSAISISATIKHGAKIGTHSLIGAGALLMKNCRDNMIMYGVPAIEIRERKIGEKYL